MAISSAAFQPQQTASGFEVRGRVVDAVKGTPVEGARVTLASRAPGRSQATLTDDHGTFVLRAPGAGQYQLSASLGSRAFGMYGVDPFSGDPGWFSLSARTAGIVIELWRVPHLEGTVLDENDQPLEGTLVMVLRTMTLGNRQVVSTVRRTPTAATGAYSMDVTAPCRCLVVAVPRVAQAGPARAPEYFPGVRSPSAASPVELAKGESTTVDFRLHGERGFVISGVVQLPSGFEGADSIDLFDVTTSGLPGNLVAAHASLSPFGAFSFPPVPAGSYEIRFVRYAAHGQDDVLDGVVRYNDQRLRAERLAPVPEGPTWWAAERVSVVDRDVTVTVPLNRGVRVSGTMVFEGPGPAPDSSLLPTRAVYLRSVDYRFFRPFQAGSAREDGAFRTVAVPPGQYVLGVTGPFGASQPFEGYQLESVRVDGREVAGVSFDLDHDITNAVLTFSSTPSVIMGSVQTTSSQQAFVVVWPEEERLWSGRGTELGRVALAQVEGGTYRIPVFPGAYRIAAVSGAPPRDWEATAYLRGLFGVSVQVTVPRRQSVVRNLIASRASRQEGS